jgi:hypothetical protein
MKACAVENINKGYKNRHIYFLSDSQAAIKALDKYQTISKLFWDCLQTLMKLAEHNRVQMIRVSGYRGTERHDIANYLGKNYLNIYL